jgi:hypothetical protein
VSAHGGSSPGSVPFTMKQEAYVRATVSVGGNAQR